ncbi:MAG: ABC transporter ATP-binding protein [Actinomycetaceae bacterium]|nr:ABC transporter ATP-binding protein [Actinomycetaceae bacterium]
MDTLSAPALITARRVSKTFRAVTALKGVDFHLRAGESVAVMGPSGAGKTTLLLTLAGIVRPDQGSVSFNGVDLTSLSDAGRAELRRDHCGFVFQDSQLVSELSVLDNVALPLLVRGVRRAEAHSRAGEMLDLVGFKSDPTTRCYQLSGGESQLATVARALVGSPKVVFADEPTGALDQATSESVIRLLVERCAQLGAALMVVTHDPNVAQWCSKQVLLEDGVLR